MTVIVLRLKPKPKRRKPQGKKTWPSPQPAPPSVGEQIAWVHHELSRSPWL